LLRERRFGREQGDEGLTPSDRPDGLALRGCELEPGVGELLPEGLPLRLPGSDRFRRRSMRNAFALDRPTSAAEPSDLPCLRGIGMMGKSGLGADDAGLPAEVSALERHGDGGAGIAEDFGCLGEGLGAFVFGGLGVLAVGRAPNALVATLAAGAASSGGSGAVGTDAGEDGRRHFAACYAEEATLLWDGLTNFGPLEMGARECREGGSADQLDTRSLMPLGMIPQRASKGPLATTVALHDKAL